MEGKGEERRKWTSSVTDRTGNFPPDRTPDRDPSKTTGPDRTPDRTGIRTIPVTGPGLPGFYCRFLVVDSEKSYHLYQGANFA